MDEFLPAGRSLVQMDTPGPQTVAFAIRGLIAPADLPGLCRRVCALLRESSADVVLCDVTGVEPDAVTVDALARLQLAAQRQRCRVRLCNASDALLDLVAFMGLEDVCCPTRRPMPRPHRIRRLVVERGGSVGADPLLYDSN